MEWLFVGSSPSVIEWLPQVLPMADVIITTNSGIKLVPTPDYYVCIDQFACVNYHDIALDAQAAGTKLITLNRSEPARKQRQIEHFDEFIDLPPIADCTREQYGRFQYSGPLCIQYACLHGAKVVHMVGTDGYKVANDYFDAHDIPQRKCQSEQTLRNINNNAIAPTMRQIAAAWHDVEFMQYGDPIYQVGYTNWKVVHDHSDHTGTRWQ